MRGQWCARHLAFKEFSSERAWLRNFRAHTRDAVRQERAESALSHIDQPFQVPGYCVVCHRRRDFDVTWKTPGGVPGHHPNWREELGCPGCLLSNRMRASIHYLERLCPRGSESPLFLTEQVTMLHAQLVQRYPNLTGSEYSPNRTELGHVDSHGVRREDLTKLSFATSALGGILSFDVLEHVPDYRAALTECARCLRPGGFLLFTVPFDVSLARSRQLAQITPAGDVRHFGVPEYHGDPLNSAGCLCFHRFGWDLLDQLRGVGFATATALTYWSKRLGYLGRNQFLFLAVKAKE